MKFKTKPWQHQIEAIDFGLKRPAALYNMSMGTGKSLVSVGLIVNRNVKNVLVICPLAVVPAWEVQFEEHCPIPYRITLLNKGSVKKKLALAQKERELAGFADVLHVIVINYDSMWRAPIGDWFLRKKFDMVVADECFTEDVLVETPNGPVPIPEIKVGDKVWGFSGKKGKVEAEVLHLFKNKAPDEMLTWPGGAITKNHPVYVVPGQYVEASQVSGLRGLKFKDQVLAEAALPEVDTVLSDNSKVYNIETTTGNYFAGGFLVHNCHRVKSPGGKASRFAARLGKTTPIRIGLSGTPLAHSPLDAYGEFRFLDPTIFGTSFTRFRSRYAIMGGFEGRAVIGYQNERDFNKKFHSITFTRDRSVIDLPDETHVTIPVELPVKTMRLYKELENELVADVEDGVVTVQNALTKLLRLQQITSGHIVKDDEEKATVLHSEKESALETIMDGLEKDEPLVVFCRFRADLDAVHRAAAASKRESLELSGSRKELERWQEGEASVIAVQIQSGSEGITLVRACYAVYFSIGFSLSQYEQSLARICRPGQERACTYYHLVCKGTVDQKVYRALKQRKKVIEEILRELGGE